MLRPYVHCLVVLVLSMRWTVCRMYVLLYFSEFDTSRCLACPADVEWGSLAVLTALKRLKLSKREHAADRRAWVPLAPFGQLTALTSLALVEFPAADSDFSFLSLLPNLAEVCLKNTNFDLWIHPDMEQLSVLAPAVQTLTSLQLTQTMTWDSDLLFARQEGDLHLPKGVMNLNVLGGLAVCSCFLLLLFLFCVCYVCSGCAQCFWLVLGLFNGSLVRCLYVLSCICAPAMLSLDFRCNDEV